MYFTFHVIERLVFCAPIVLIFVVNIPWSTFIDHFQMSFSKFVSPCHGDSIAIYNSTSGAVKCQACVKCPQGRGLSVQCSSVQSPETPVVCEPCVLGKTYSSGKDAGACMSCENCEEYRETIKACTLTSKAVCGKCKPGAYQDDRLTHLCQPCSRCCDDQDDLVEPQCQEMPENKRCSFHRSHVCSKVITRANFSSVSSVETNHTASLVLVSSPTSQVTTSLSMHTAYQKTPVADRPSRAAIIGAAVGVTLAVVLLLLVICYFLKKKSNHRVNKRVNDAERPQETRSKKESSGTDLERFNTERSQPAEDSNATSPGSKETQILVQNSTGQWTYMTNQALNMIFTESIIGNALSLISPFFYSNISRCLQAINRGKWGYFAKCRRNSATGLEQHR